VASAYGWVTILLYFLWLNEHIHLYKLSNEIGKWLVWEIGNKRKLGMGADPWVGSAEGFKLSHDMINYLHGKFSYLIK